VTRLLVWIVDLLLWTHKPKPRPIAATLVERVRLSESGMARLTEMEIVHVTDLGTAQLSSPELVRVSDHAAAVLTGAAAPLLPLAASIGEGARMADLGTAQLSGPELLRLSDLVAGLMTGPHRPVVGGIVCDFCSDELRIRDMVTARIGGPR
jgi:hypothetical protein